jgi:NADH dehydrogenase
MTVVVGGPTGVNSPPSPNWHGRFERDFRRIDPAQARILLLEGSPVILANLPPDLSASAARQLQQLGVQVRVSTRVRDIRRAEVELESGEVIRADNIFWAAGVSASALTRKLGAELDRAGRVKVNPDLSVPGHPETFAIGDLALVLQGDGRPVPGVSPAAMQMGRHVAKIIDEELRAGRLLPNRPSFRYRDKGTMATIGRSAAVAQIGG